MAGPSYARVRSSDDDERFDPTEKIIEQSQSIFIWRLWPWIAHTILLTVSLTLFINGVYLATPSQARCAQILSSYSPAVTAVEYEDVKFNGSLKAPSVYRGNPSPEIDEAWSRVTKSVPLFSITEDDVAKLNKNKDEIVKVPDAEGGGYLAGLEASHQIHCVNLLRMYTHFDYYKDIEPAFTDPPDVLRYHIDHCLEMLRTNIMCAADTGIITFNWVEGHETPFPDFSTWHRCRKVDKVLGWADDRGLEWNARLRPADAVDVPEGSV
ncbi:hypothetical protein K491DRAFT_774261 [Lophiostoma macrostomum CBS 122681]|uniref:Tat pathway signal sequence n=1 Tax=Lophiostoma macrostomum CBS 122681 TaxID=1314788 RepID=A0A6A6TM70_9PLEO|nr:hypothetical protein K491DRAFT_774261 [Lophiostoma macrostomum CBS 122681]